MLDNVERFDLKRKPTRQRLRPLLWTLCIPANWAHKGKIEKINMKGIKPPYLLLQNHNAFLDFKVLTKAVFPHRCNYVIAIDGFIKREGLLRNVGGICKRKFTKDITLIRQLKEVVKNKDIAVIYPEARYSLCGTTAILPPSLGKLAKLLKVPVVVLLTHGHHINAPFFNIYNHHIKGISATMTCIANEEEVKNLTADELNDRINESFIYDDYKWAKENNIKNKYKKRAEGLDKVLYQCPSCNTEYEMSSNLNILKCNACGKTWEMTESSELKALDGKDIFTHIPDWYEWERENVKKEVENGTYHFERKVRVDALPNAKGYIDLGEGYLIHDMNGFKLSGKYDNENYELSIPEYETYGVHIEYEYLHKFGDCIDLNTLTDTFYVYPDKNTKFSVTKISLATEELYKNYWKNKK
ncbi:MAG: hypothetical protein K6G38_03585 [Gammaproteobacteria bacterium]|nr:hypothetical protein [Gammaproteobacteria bacterium]